MKKRNLLFVLFMQIITLGIYHLYWLYKTRKEMISKGAQGIWPVSVLLAPILVIVLIMGLSTAAFVIQQSAANSSQENQTLSSVTPDSLAEDSPIREFFQEEAQKIQEDSLADDSQSVLNILTFLIGILAVVALVAVLPIMLFWHYKYCKAVEFVTGGRSSLSFMFGMFILLWIIGIGFVWPMIVQDAFNDLADNTGHPNGPQPLQPPYTMSQQTPQPPHNTPPSGPIA